MKKLLAILLAVLTVFSFCSVAAAAEDVSEPASEPATEPVETFNTYEICEDPDFLVLKYMAEGNDKATLLHPGDQITTYRNSNIDVLYYADADAMYKGDWEPSDPNNLAFSPSAAEQFKETFSKQEGVATVRNLGDTVSDGKIDFTIAYSEENTFLGWVVYDFDPAKNTIKLCAVWEKNHTIVETEEKDEMNTILDFFFNIRRAMHENITLPLLQVIRSINNAFLALETYLYNLFFNKEPAA